MATNSSQLLTSLLKEVSRSFYLTMRVLPDAIRPQISIAYLLARIADTIADTEIVPIEERLSVLTTFCLRISGVSNASLHFNGLADNQTLPEERVLLERCEDALALLSSCSANDQQKIRKLLGIITSGQALDLQRFADANEKKIVALSTDEDLDDYTYRVAGCVGEFWTNICLTLQFTLNPFSGFSERDFEQLGIRFGKGLQLVNILRDLPRDLRNGRCYVPASKLEQIKLVPSDLLKPENEVIFRAVYDQYLNLAESHLAAGWQYVQAIPRGQIRVRLACAWPILFGMKTVDKLRSETILDPTRRVKISRAEVRELMLKSLLFYPFSKTWNSQFKRSSRS